MELLSLGRQGFARSLRRLPQRGTAGSEPRATLLVSESMSTPDADLQEPHLDGSIFVNHRNGERYF